MSGHTRPRTLVTGGTGFIGTNLADALAKTDRDLVIIARKPPRCVEHKRFFRSVDIRDIDGLRSLIRDFAPTEIVHLAAQTDFVTWEDKEGFRANTAGIENLIRILGETNPPCRLLFASSHVVDFDRNRGMVYAESKRAGEAIVRQADWKQHHVATIIRPCSIWGPWFTLPFLPFFSAIARGRYFHLGKVDPPKRIGFVGNTCHQIIRLLEAPAEQVQGQTFYLADYETTTIRNWANLIAAKCGRRIRTLPESFVRAAAWAGDALKLVGVGNPPISSVRLANMRAGTADVSIDAVRVIAGELPYTLEQGVEITLSWMRTQDLIA